MHIHFPHLSALLPASAAFATHGAPGPLASEVPLYTLIFVLYILALFAVFSVIIAGMVEVFNKSGKPAWAAGIPFYNTIELFDIAGLSPWWSLTMYASLVAYLIPYPATFFALPLFMLIAVGFSAWMWYRLAKAFGKSGLFSVGLTLLAPVFIPILGFGSSSYTGPARNASVKEKVLILVIECVFMIFAFGLFFYSIAAFAGAHADVIGTNAPGMHNAPDKVYTDTRYGFSLSYPSDLHLVTEGPEVRLYDAANHFIALSATSTDTLVQSDPTNGTVSYYYYPKRSLWMMDTTKANSDWLAYNALTSTVGPAQDVLETNDGLPVFAGTALAQTDIVPLGAHTFVILETADGVVLPSVEDDIAASVAATAGGSNTTGY